jgi:large subunit ribosomal protein L32
MPVPKRKLSKMRTRRRRSEHDKIAGKNVIACDNCGMMKLPHRVCLGCGTYKGRQIIQIVAG